MVYVTIGWVLAYTLCLASIGLFAYAYALSRDKRILAFGSILVNMLLVTALIMIMTFGAIKQRTLNFVLLNALSLYGLSVPFYIIETSGLKPRFSLVVFVAYLCSLAVANALLANGHGVLPFLTIMTPFALTFFAVFSPSLRSPSERPISYVAFWRDIRSLGFGVFLIVSLAISLHYAVFRGAIKENRLANSLFYSGLTIAYQIPCLVFAAKVIREKRRRGRFAATEAVGRLSAREREVAEKLCMGLKYEEIAQQLFVSLATIKKHAYNIYRKLDISNARQLINLMRETEGSGTTIPSDKPQP